MPGIYAHYRFGAQLLPNFSPEVRRVVKRHRSLYDMGLHGPDLLYYHNVLKRTEQVSLGYRIHRERGKTVFTRAAKRLRLEPSEPGLAYLYGLLAHYCLDRYCHPLIHMEAEAGTAGHIRMETEFDRFLLELDGKKPARTQDISPHMALTDPECAVVAWFYPSVTAKDVRRSVTTMARVTRILAMPQGRIRDVLENTIGRKFSQHIMGQQPDPACAHLDAALLTLYGDAFAAYPVLEKQLTAYLTCGVPLGADFDPIFG